MTAGFKGVRAAFRVTVKTDFLLFKRVENAVSCNMHLVAGSASNVFHLVPASEPGQSALCFMTVQTNPILCFDGCFRLLAKDILRQYVHASSLGEYVVLAGTMTGFAL